MNNKRFRLTPALRKEITASIRAGGYPHVAAEAWGVPKTILDDWLQRGNAAKAREPYRSFAHAVREASAQARLFAEIAAYKDEPKVWLVHGPGRESEERPGWSLSVKPAVAAATERNVLGDPHLMQLFHMLLQVLTPFPEARRQAAQALMNLGVKQESEHGKTSV